MDEFAHMVSTSRWVNVHRSMMAQNNRSKKCQKRVKIFFQKNLFQPKIFEKPLFLVKNSINTVSQQSSIDVGMRAIAQNDHNAILLKWAKKNFKILPSKIQKIDFFGPKMTKNDEKIEIFSKIFIGRNRLIFVQNVL